MQVNAVMSDAVASGSNYRAEEGHSLVEYTFAERGDFGGDGVASFSKCVASFAGVDEKTIKLVKVT